MRQLAVSISFALAAVFLFLCTPSSGGVWPENCGKNKTHNFFFGNKWYYDRLLYVNQTVRPKSFARKLSFDVQIPPKNVYQSGVITYIEVLDQYRNGKGGCAYLKSGGIGHKNVTLHIKSQQGEGVNFVINVYGH